MAGKSTRVIVFALCVVAEPLWAKPAEAGAPGYCPGDGLIHDWDTEQPIGSCPIGGGLLSTQKGNVWVDRNGTVHQAPTPQGDANNGAYPDNYSPEGGDEPNRRPVPVQPGAPPPGGPGTAGSIGGGP